MKTEIYNKIKQEAEELIEKINKLEKFLNDPKSESLCERIELDMLQEQFQHMYEYLGVLRMRMAYYEN